LAPCSAGWWLVLIYCEKKVRLAGGWADLACEESTVAGWLELPAEQGLDHQGLNFSPR